MVQFVADGDSSAPNAPSNVTVDVGPGRQVTIDWDQVSADDLKEYKLYRNTSNNFSTATVQKTVEGGEAKQGFDKLTAGTT